MQLHLNPLAEPSTWVVISSADEGNKTLSDIKIKRKYILQIIVMDIKAISVSDHIRAIDLNLVHTISF
jgi:hypothetical protein